jgi:tRNA A37 threonylcarbamoyladenosine dehydratase
VQLVQEGQEAVDSNIANDYMDEDSIVIVDSNDIIEPKVVNIGTAQNSAKEVLSFMASHGSQGFTTTKFYTPTLLMMERIRNKRWRSSLNINKTM